MNKINTNVNMKNLFYINNLKFKVRELCLEQFLLIMCYKTRNTLKILHKRELREPNKEFLFIYNFPHKCINKNKLRELDT